MNLLELHEKPSIFKITPHVATIAILCFIVLTITSFMLINQIIKCKKYKIKYRNLFETLRNLQYQLLELDFNYDDHTRPIEEYIKTTQKMKNIQKIYNKVKQCKLILKLTSSILILSIIYIIINNHTIVKNAFISDIKNNITINNDQLIVNKLPSNYHYTNKKLDENKQETFKMMHKDSEIVLIDKNQNEYRVQQEDYNNIKKNNERN